PNSDSAVWLQENRPLTPGELNGAALIGHIRTNRPAFVLNACHGGREGWSLTGLGGWANKLVSKGAGLFLAPLWEVNDGSAYLFARTFYEEVAAGKPVADAVHQGRRRVRQAGDPTWLAYSLYADPGARVVVGPAAPAAGGRPS